MTDQFRMDSPQPRLLDHTGQGLIGTPMDRPEGPKKVSGAAQYTADHLPEGCAHGVLVRATISKGQVRSIDTGTVQGLPGILGVFHGPKFIRNPAQGMAGAAPVQPGTRVDYHGQPIALVVGESFEAAREGALALGIRYDEDAAEVDPATASIVERDDADTRGDWDAAWTAAHVRVDQTYDLSLIHI